MQCLSMIFSHFQVSTFHLDTFYRSSPLRSWVLHVLCLFLHSEPTWAPRTSSPLFLFTFSLAKRMFFLIFIMTLSFSYSPLCLVKGHISPKQKLNASWLKICSVWDYLKWSHSLGFFSILFMFHSLEGKLQNRDLNIQIHFSSVSFVSKEMRARSDSILTSFFSSLCVGRVFDLQLKAFYFVFPSKLLWGRLEFVSWPSVPNPFPKSISIGFTWFSSISGKYTKL